MLYKPDTMLFEEPITLMVMDDTGGRMEGLTVNFKYAPFAVTADQEVRFPIEAVLTATYPRRTIG